MEKTTVSAKGQVVIPAKIRKLLGIKAGTTVCIEEKKGDIILHPITADFYDRLSGILKGGNALKLLEETRRKEGRLEEKRLGRKKGFR